MYSLSLAATFSLSLTLRGWAKRLAVGSEVAMMVPLRSVTSARVIGFSILSWGSSFSPFPSSGEKPLMQMPSVRTAMMT